MVAFLLVPFKRSTHPVHCTPAFHADRTILQCLMEESQEPGHDGTGLMGCCVATSFQGVNERWINRPLDVDHSG